MAPEVLQRKAATFKSDVYAFGVVVFGSAFGYLPPPIFTPQGPPAIPRHSNDTLVTLLSTLLHVDPSRRPDADAIFIHPFFLDHSSEVDDRIKEKEEAATDAFKFAIKTFRDGIDVYEPVELTIDPLDVVNSTVKALAAEEEDGIDCWMSRKFQITFEGEEGIDSGLASFLHQYFFLSYDTLL